MKVRQTWTLLLAAIALAIPASFAVAADAPIPSRPESHILDEAQVLPQALQGALKTLVFEHQKIAGEQIFIAILKNAADRETAALSRSLFSAWKIGKGAKANGALLLLLWEDRVARIEVGYGLEHLLTDSKTKSVVHEFLLPELRAGSPDRAVSLATLEILRSLESPLVLNGKAQEILRQGGFQGSWEPASAFEPKSWGFVWVIGIAFLALAFTLLTAAEAHYTSQGWIHPRPWKEIYQELKQRLNRRGAIPGPTRLTGGTDGSW